MIMTRSKQAAASKIYKFVVNGLNKMKYDLNTDGFNNASEQRIRYIYMVLYPDEYKLDMLISMYSKKYTKHQYDDYKYTILCEIKKMIHNTDTANNIEVINSAKIMFNSNINVVPFQSLTAIGW